MIMLLMKFNVNSESVKIKSSDESGVPMIIRKFAVRKIYFFIDPDWDNSRKILPKI